MNIVIAGGGDTGLALCKEFSSTLNVILIERDPGIVDRAVEDYDIEAIVGEAEDVRIQREARVDSCDVFIAVTSHEQANMIACVVAKRLGARHTIARVREPDFMPSANYIKDELGISEIINPNYEMAVKIRELVKFEEAKSIEYFINGRLILVAFEMDVGMDMVGKRLYEANWKDINLLVCLIEREGEFIIPNGYTRLQAKDIIYVTGKRESIFKFYKDLNLSTEPVDSVFIIGGSRTSHYLISSLVNANIMVKLVEKDYDRAVKFASDYPQAIVIHGDGTDQDLLENENIAYYDAVITLTGVDEENLLTNLYASYMGIEKTIAKVTNNNLIKLLTHEDIGISINPKRLMVDRIARFVRSITPRQHSSINNLYTIAGGRAVALEFKVGEGNKWCQAPLKDLGIKEGVLVAGIARNGEVFIPNGDFKIHLGDIAVVITSHVEYEELEGILENE